ncbi:hypothetical protein LTSEADE_3544, partial [Salmonella enterica subsp. enterica serovar Adelaide str. A4-669]
MFFIKLVGFIQITAAENFRIRITEQFFAEQSTNRVIYRIADNCGSMCRIKSII